MFIKYLAKECATSGSKCAIYIRSKMKKYFKRKPFSTAKHLKD